MMVWLKNGLMLPSIFLPFNLFVSPVMQSRKIQGDMFLGEDVQHSKLEAFVRP